MNKRRVWWGMLALLMMCLNVAAYGQGRYVMIEGVPTMNQHPNMPTGCEVTALTMLLRYYGINVSKEQLGKDMPKKDFYYKDGKTYGPHPSEAFLGSPFSKSGFGVYAPVIIDLAEKHLPNRVEDLTGKEFDELLKCIDESRPVMIWATINMVPMKLTRSWYLKDGTQFTWKANEHALIMVGYDDSYIYMNDPYTGKREKYSRQKVVNRWESMGRQAIAIKPAEVYQKAVVGGDSYENKVMIDKEGTWIPAKFLTIINQDINVSYDQGVVRVAKGEQEHYMDLGNPQNYYKLKGETTYVELNWLRKYLGITYIESEKGFLLES